MVSQILSEHTLQVGDGVADDLHHLLLHVSEAAPDTLAHLACIDIRGHHPQNVRSELGGTLKQMSYSAAECLIENPEPHIIAVVSVGDRQITIKRCDEGFCLTATSRAMHMV